MVAHTDFIEGGDGTTMAHLTCAGVRKLMDIGDKMVDIIHYAGRKPGEVTVGPAAQRVAPLPILVQQPKSLEKARARSGHHGQCNSNVLSPGWFRIPKKCFHEKLPSRSVIATTKFVAPEYYVALKKTPPAQG